MKYRNLTNEEIRILERHRCRAENWNLVKVEATEGTNEGTTNARTDEGTTNARVNEGTANEGTANARTNGKNSATPNFSAKRVKFEGNVNIGAGCTLVDSTIANCTIGARTQIRNTERIENYTIGDDCLIYNDGSIVAREWAAMGCGTTVNVLDETGGRQVTICPEYSAQTAYMMAFYRHDPTLVERLKGLVAAWGKEHSTRQGRIGNGVTICYVTAIEDVNIGDRSQIRSAVKLENGTLGVETQVLENVSAADFILSDRAVIGTSCVAKHVFLGQAASLNNSFVAHNSLIFANSVLECGETDALFAGPHTVSFHRSTLLIAAATSFFNAGSGTNQSNHYYCTGPIHHGVLERGCKTGSNSYIKWPARIGQFTVIIGSHGNHPDTSSLPFSYVFGNEGETTVIPAANIRTCGVMRDVLKWRGRDKRGFDSRHLDCINYEEFTPYNADRMFQGISLLERIRSGEVSLSELRFHISPGHITEGIRLYGIGLRYFFGSVLVDRILTLPANSTLSEIYGAPPTRAEIFPWKKTDEPTGTSTETQIADSHEKTSLRETEDDPTGTTANTQTPVSPTLEETFQYPEMSPWVDMAGMIAPRPVIDELCRQIDEGKFTSLRELDDAILRIHQNYALYRWLYVRDRIDRVFEIAPNSATVNGPTKATAGSPTTGCGPSEAKAGTQAASEEKPKWVNVEDLMEIVRQWEAAAKELGAMRTADALKDFSPEMSVGFGIDHPELAQADHENSLGIPDENPHVRNIREHYALDSRRAATAHSRLQSL